MKSSSKIIRKKQKKTFSHFSDRKSTRRKLTRSKNDSVQFFSYLMSTKWNKFEEHNIIGLFHLSSWVTPNSTYFLIGRKRPTYPLISELSPIAELPLPLKVRWNFYKIFFFAHFHNFFSKCIRNEVWKVAQKNSQFEIIPQRIQQRTF